MKQELAVLRTYVELRREHIIPVDLTVEQVEKARVLLMRLYAIGFDEGRLQGAHNKKVDQLDMKGNYIQTFESISVAARSIDRNKSAVAKAAQGKIEYSGGFKWKYTDNGTSENNH